jgi:hypothetical protein
MRYVPAPTASKTSQSAMATPDVGAGDSTRGATGEHIEAHRS